MSVRTITVLCTRVSEQATTDDGLVRHRGRAWSLLESHGGTVASSRPTGLVAVFASATGAVDASVALQQVTERDERLLGGVVGLRIGIHAADVTDGDESVDVSRTTAAVVADVLCGAAGPGQVITSEVVTALAGPLPGLDFRSLDPPGADLGAAPVRRVEVVWRPLASHPAISVVVAEDSILVRAGIVALLREEGFDVLAEAGDAESLLEAARRHRPMLVVTDVRMPPTQRDEGIVAAVQLRAEDSAIGVLVLSQHIEIAAAASLLADRPVAVGYLLKERVSRIDDFIAACRVVAGGGVVIDPLVTERLVGRPAGESTARLTDREIEVLGLMAQGRSNQAIARDIGCSGKTLEAHIRSVFVKLGLEQHPDEHRRVAAVIQYLQSVR